MTEKQKKDTIHENEVKSPWKLHYMKSPSFLKIEGMFLILDKVGETFLNGAVPKQIIMLP